MKLNDLIKELEVVKINGDLDISIENIAFDSRKVRQNTLFICIEGYAKDGHDYIDAALANGALALIVQREINIKSNVPVIMVRDSRVALACISNIFFNRPSQKLNIIGVTGTKGKTTITYMIKSILEAHGERVGLIGTVVNSIADEVLPSDRTTPESLELQMLFNEMLEKNVKNVVMEVSSHALELNRVAFTKFNIGIFSNLSLEHMDFHKNFENYFNAKSKLFKLSNVGFVNIDNEYGERIKNNPEYKIITFGIEKNADYRAVDVLLMPLYTEFNLVTPKEAHKIRVNIPGKFTVYNAIAAISACLYMNIPIETIKKGLLSVSVPGRAELLDINKDYSIIIDYAHTPDSLKNILETVKNYKKGRLICLFGCGGDRDKTKRPIMGEISGEMADFTIITSDNPRTENPESIIDEIEVGIKNKTDQYKKITNRKDAIKYAIEVAKPQDVIVLAGKGHETYQIFEDKTIHFDEREEVRKILEELDKA